MRRARTARIDTQPERIVPRRPGSGRLTGELDVRRFDHGLELHALYLLGQLDPSAVVRNPVVGLLGSRDRANVALVVACGDVDRCADWQGAAWRESWHGLGSLARPFCASRETEHDKTGQQ